MTRLSPRLGIALLGGAAMGMAAVAMFAPVESVRAAPAGSCESLTGLTIAEGKIDSAVMVKQGEAITTEAGKPGLPAPAAFCRVHAVLKPTLRSEVKIEVWLPEGAAWNGKLLGAGNGGYGGTLTLPALTMRTGIAKGYAATGSDMGHLSNDVDAKWALNEPEKVVDFGHRANHLAALLAKQVVGSYYPKPLAAAYFHGCSDGGREALNEAQRYPTDYDAIIAGAPANPWTRLMAGFMADHRAAFGKPDSIIPNAKLKLLQTASLAKCDAADGVTDKVIDDPRKCSFDPGVLQCKAGDAADCLTAPQVETARALYRGTVDAKGKSIFPGYMPGAEAVAGTWDLWLTGANAQHGRFSTEFYRYMVHANPAWQPTDYDPIADPKLAAKKFAGILDASADLSAFYKRGGKLILYHGWYDAAIPPENTINYYEDLKRMQRQAASSTRLFMVPGLSHCLGGPGATGFDPLTALDQWRQGGPAPEQMVATRYDNPIFAYFGLPAKALGTRPLCAYPKVARWKGTGSTDDAGNFDCVAPS
ncbi:tannase/feruloyl esterase family alpha/beta hydrolase [Sphingomonas alpina]|uniref:Tannase/feruloyl esterase family alpha/beta hydrolase n=1 Tax=Sphingomonas alpina TaxID=653931 RepID=A0A7H0LGT7_9SPHN|nr:tannase/feruloyl esterase family alpha/beta hydrolase [Sphingomonas alpina]QNQ08890.1 tannase/feruloyl esterase family alpha/beta hydrolase [Sphingomonas alpina]